MNHIAVFDIGKTNVKLTVVDAAGKVVSEQRRPNVVITDGVYPHADVAGIWAWLCQTLRGLPQVATIRQFVTTTHGATAALVGEGELVLPVLDYEYPLPDIDGYTAVRPAFTETCSPDLPTGLNLGRQLYWQHQQWPAAFARVQHILMYPQYWGWKLTGNACTEVTSLGCHTDLWSPQADTYSSLVTRMGWAALFPPRVRADQTIGHVTPAVADATGLPTDCEVIAGIHDSNASLLPYLTRHRQTHQPVTVLSSGTWLIMAHIGGDVSRLDEHQDMLANVSADSDPVACARFMAGREFATLVGDTIAPCTEDDIRQLIAEGALALPSFASGGGPFMGQAGRLVGLGTETPARRYALATLYLAVMTHYCLDLLGTTGEHIIEGSLSNNPFYARLLAGLRPDCQLKVSADVSGTTGGALLLCHGASAQQPAAPVVTALAGADMQAYYQTWRSMLPAMR